MRVLFIGLQLLATGAAMSMPIDLMFQPVKVEGAADAVASIVDVMPFVPGDEAALTFTVAKGATGYARVPDNRVPASLTFTIELGPSAYYGSDVQNYLRRVSGSITVGGDATKTWAFQTQNVLAFSPVSTYSAARNEARVAAPVVLVDPENGKVQIRAMFVARLRLEGTSATLYQAGFWMDEPLATLTGGKYVLDTLLPGSVQKTRAHAEEYWQDTLLLGKCCLSSLYINTCNLQIACGTGPCSPKCEICDPWPEFCACPDSCYV